jgi:hypothetical protein
VSLSTLSADNLLNYWGANYGKYVSLHSAYSTSGANELTGGSPAYARLAASWGSASGNSMSLTSTPYTFNVPASSTVAFVGYWDSLTGGNFQGMFPVGNSTGYAFSAPSATSTLLAPGSAYTANQTVCVFATGGSTTPGGLTVGTIYYVKSPSSDSFELSATSGGSAITVTADGSGLIQAISAEVFTGAGSYALSSGTMTLV